MVGSFGLSRSWQRGRRKRGRPSNRVVEKSSIQWFGGTMTTTTGRYGAMEMRHSRSEDLLGVISGSRSPSPNVPLPSTASEDDLIAASALHEATDTTIKPTCPLLSSRPAGFPADRIDPEDSIRDIVTENDLYRFVWNFPFLKYLTYYYFFILCI